MARCRFNLVTTNLRHLILAKKLRLGHRRLLHTNSIRICRVYRINLIRIAVIIVRTSLGNNKNNKIYLHDQQCKF